MSARQGDVIRLRDVLKRLPVLVRKAPHGLRAAPYLLTMSRKKRRSIGTFIERNALEHPHHAALMYEDRRWTWAELNAWINRVANHLLAQGLMRGDVVALLMENRPEYLVVTAALAKIGAVGALVNSSQRRQVLVHSLEVSEPRMVVVGAELLDALEEALDLPEAAELNVGQRFVVQDDEPREVGGWVDLMVASATASGRNPSTTGRIRLEDPCYYIYTSGTTGLPKASVMTHYRWIKAATGMGMYLLELEPGEVMYSSLPLYHNTALTIGWGSVVVSGAALALRRRFSVSGFFEDTRRYQATAFCYVGELCAYLLEAYPHGAPNPIRKMIGVGLRPEMWAPFRDRFGVEDIYEIYAASEGNSAFVNLFNLEGTVGLCASPYAIVRYDVDADEPVRDDKGRFIRVDRGEAGLLLFKVSDLLPFDGYTDPEASERKLFRDVFRRGDVWYNSGDLLRDLGWRHAAFVDRVGDTFRWKAENVSTREVEQVTNALDGVRESTVYGVKVPGASGRAGMVALVGSGDGPLDVDALLAHYWRALPRYSVPLFVRLREELEVTGTFKHRKVSLRREGFDPGATPDPLYVLLPGAASYVPLTQEIYEAIQDGAYAF